MKELKFYRCKHCGNLVSLLCQGGGQLVCCGEPMEELTANTVDASHEKHVPVVTVDGDSVRVSVGAAPHPMTTEHAIQWICLQTEHGAQLRDLRPGEAPETEFLLTGDRPVAVFAWCNLHGLWKTEW